MKKLPIGIQEFLKLREENFLYIDKTQHIYNLINSGSYYFLSRPRRFGKSLLLNTIKEIFLGNKELFKGLWIYDKIDFKRHPVIKISFSNLGYSQLGLEEAIENALNDLADNLGVKLVKKGYPLRFRELIEKASVNTKVVILIDEYDKPIIDYINDIPKAEENRQILKNFYSVIKDSDNYIRFFFITGVSKFSHVSIFSDLNNLSDITLNRNFSVLLGYTQEELEHYFKKYISKLSEIYKGVFDDVLKQIKKSYNGYSWDGEHFVYNPFSVLNLFFNDAFRDYWFATGTPTFLMKMIREKRFTVFDIESKSIFENELEKYEITDISLLPLLFQTGYLTIKEVNRREGTLLLDFPNQEVERSFTIHLLSELNNRKLDSTSTLLVDIMRAFKSNNIEKFIESLNILFKGISYTLVDDKEKYFHSLFYMIIRLLGFTIESEVLTIDGRIDAVVFTDDYIHIIEFKVKQDAQTALNQIKEKQYALKYADDKREKVLLGINFDTETKSVDDWVRELQVL